MDAAGGAVEDTYVSTGSGSPFVYGVLETEYTKDMKIDLMFTDDLNFI